MVVACIGHGKVLRLSEDIVRLKGQSELVLEKKLRDLGIENELILLWSGIAVVPVIIEICDKVYAPRNGPVHRSIHLIAPCRIEIEVFHGIP